MNPSLHKSKTLNGVNSTNMCLKLEYKSINIKQFDGTLSKLTDNRDGSNGCF